MNTEPDIRKARSLAAFLAPDSGASETERTNAAALLQKLMDKTGLTMDDITGTTRTRRTIICTTMDQLRLAAQVARWLLDNEPPIHFLEKMDETTTRRGKLKRVKYWEVYCDMTDAEAREWQRAFHHYRPEFEATVKALKATAAAATKAVKMALPAFCSRHEIYPSATKAGKPMTRTQAAAFREAFAHAQGQKYAPPAPQLTA